jgi:hypothetical protein
VLLELELCSASAHSIDSWEGNMNAGFNLKPQFANAGLVAALMVGGAATAQTLPKEGTYDYTACWSGVSTVIAFSKTHSAFSYEMTGSTRTNPPGGMFDKNSFRCVGMNASFGGKNTASTACEAIDRDGDKRLAYFSLTSDGKVIREEIAGTGKYDGMVTSGTTVAPLGPFPVIKAGTFQNCNHQKGAYKLK